MTRWVPLFTQCLIERLQVKKSSKLDPCLTPPEEVGNHLKRRVTGEGNELDGFLKKGEVNNAATLAMTVMKAANAGSDCGSGLSILDKEVVRIGYNCKSRELIKH